MKLGWSVLVSLWIVTGVSSVDTNNNNNNDNNNNNNHNNNTDKHNNGKTSNIGIESSFRDGNNTGNVTYSFGAWSEPIRNGVCSLTSYPKKIEMPMKDGSGVGYLHCKRVGGVKHFTFPPGIFEINQQFLVPEKTTIEGNQDPNDYWHAKVSPDYTQQTLFLATRGATEWRKDYCYADDMVTTRVGFVLSSYTKVVNVSYQGVDTIRPDDNNSLCGGGAFETKGCAQNDCSGSDVNNGGSDGKASRYVTLENIRINDYYFDEDQDLIAVEIPGNNDCDSHDSRCCFCMPNNVRSTQVGIWVPQTRDDQRTWTEYITITNVVSRSTQADGINLHGNVRHVQVTHTNFFNTGDDSYAVWGATNDPYNITFTDTYAENPGSLRPKWYGNCYATYGLQQVLWQKSICRTIAPQNPSYQPWFNDLVCVDTSMFVFYTTFGADYPDDNNVTIDGWGFLDYDGNLFTPDGPNGTIGIWEEGKMVWTSASYTDNSTGSEFLPFYIPTHDVAVNVYTPPRSPSPSVRGSPLVDVRTRYR